MWVVIQRFAISTMIRLLPVYHLPLQSVAIHLPMELKCQNIQTGTQYSFTRILLRLLKSMCIRETSFTLKAVSVIEVMLIKAANARM